MANWQETQSNAIDDAPTDPVRSGGWHSLRQRLSRSWSGGASQQGSDDSLRQSVGRARQLLAALLMPLRPAFAAIGWVAQRLGRITKPILPQGLYARSLLIIITPVVILQSVVAFVFMERHWELVTERLSLAVTRDIGAVIEMVESFQDNDADQTEVIKTAVARILAQFPPTT